MFDSPFYKIAVVDIGSNAIRFQLSRITTYEGLPMIKKLEYVRFPLRLGHDVFSKGSILAETEAKFMKLMRTFQLLLELYEVEDYMICATSAMREADNGREIAQKVLKEIGLKILIIDGDEEADLVNTAIVSYLDDRNCIHVDVGGGSTELNLYYQKEKFASKSFKMGSVRELEHKEANDMREKMREWINRKITKYEGEFVAIGTGGNITKIFDLATHKNKDLRSTDINEVIRVRDMIAQYDIKEREVRFSLNENRSDVIIPATEIYLEAMRCARAQNLIVPDVGLKDGMILSLYQKIIKK